MPAAWASIDLRVIELSDDDQVDGRWPLAESLLQADEDQTREYRRLDRWTYQAIASHTSRRIAQAMASGDHAHAEAIRLAHRALHAVAKRVMDPHDLSAALATLPAKRAS
jgi:hypothetical protein